MPFGGDSLSCRVQTVYVSCISLDNMLPRPAACPPRPTWSNRREDDVAPRRPYAPRTRTPKTKTLILSSRSRILDK